MEVIDYIDSLVRNFNYKNLPKDLSIKSRLYYLNSLPAGLNLNGSDSDLITVNGNLISRGYDRIVIGDYGAYIEFNFNQSSIKDYCIKSGQEFRITDPKLSKSVKYVWYTMPDDNRVKIYLQKRSVTYANYIPGKFYISPFDPIKWS